MEMPRPRPPHLLKERNRHGDTVWYVRKGDGPRIRIRGEYDSPEFKAAYQAAVTGTSITDAAPKARTASLQWLWDRYRESTAWAELSIATRRQRENIMRSVLAISGTAEFGAIRRGDIEAGRDRRRDTPAQALNFLKTMRGLFQWAIKMEHVSIDPTLNVDPPKSKEGEGFKAWTSDDVVKYIARWPKGTRQYVWLHVLLYVGCRRGDAVTIGKQNVRDGVLTFITEKGGVEVAMRVAPELKAALDKGPSGDLVFICGENGRPLKKESFGNDFKAAVVAAGIPDKSAHGLRKLSATLWAERGATEHELMALHGWLTPNMARLYTKKYARRKAALNAQDRLKSNA
jgi:integrase